MSIKQIIALSALVGYLTILLLWLCGSLSNGMSAILIGIDTIVMVIIGFNRMCLENKTIGK